MFRSGRVAGSWASVVMVGNFCRTAGVMLQTTEHSAGSPQCECPAEASASTPRGVICSTTDRVKIMKVVPAASKSPVVLKIPRVIWQTWKNDGCQDPNSLWVPHKRASVMLTWIQLNPTWEYRLLDDDDISRYALEQFGNEREKQVLDAIRVGASKADLWRYLVMYKNGGVYADTDSRCKENAPLDSFVDPKATYITGLGANHDFHQWVIIAAPLHCIMKNSIDKVMENAQEGTTRSTYHGLKVLNHTPSATTYSVRIEDRESRDPTVDHPVIGFSGPPALMHAANVCMTDVAKNAALWDDFRLCPGDEFSGRIMFKDTDNIHGSTYRRMEMDGVPGHTYRRMNNYDPCLPISFES